jgi:hypothetical protein
MITSNHENRYSGAVENGMGGTKRKNPYCIDNIGF